MTAPACMGGWCRHREACARYLADDRAEPAERLCPPGEDRPARVILIAAEEVAA